MREIYRCALAHMGLRALWALPCVGLLGASGAVFAAQGEGVIEEVVVTGSYIKHAVQENLSSPIDIVDQEAIQSNGWTDIEDVAETFTFAPSNFGRSGLRSTCCGLERSIDLRGLGVSSTLVMLNGKRTASTGTGPAGADFTNIKSLIPVIALERIETLLDGGSALYGSDAVAGVVNFITRDDFEGLDVRLGKKIIDGSGENEFQILAGGGGDRIHGIFALAFEHQQHMANRERDFTLINNTSGTGSPGTYFTDTRPVDPVTGGDVIIDNSLNGPVNYSQLFDDAVAGTGPFDPANGGPGAQAGLNFADPFCRSGIVPDVGPVPGGGQFTPSFPGAPFPVGVCRFSFQPNNSITPEENNWTLYTHWNIDVNEHNTIEIESSVFRSQNSTNFIATFPQTNGKPIVPASNPFNRLGVPLKWTGRSMGLAYPPKRVQGDRTGTRLSVEVNGDFAQFGDADWARSWTYTASIQYSEAREIGENPDTDLRRIQDALNGFGGQNCQIRFDGPAVTESPGLGNCFFFSPFGQNIYKNTFDPTSGFGAVGQLDANGKLVTSSDSDVRKVLGFNAQTESSDSNERTLVVFEGRVSGDLVDLPGGPAGLAFGVQERNQFRERQVPNFQNNFAQGFLTPRTGGKGHRTINAIFAELLLPVHDRVTIQAAVRREDYTGGLNSTDPKFGVNARITDTISVRGSWGTSFRAPSLGNVVGQDAQSFVAEVRDPVNPAEQTAGTFRTIILAKNPDLQPEESGNYNVGLSWAPELPWGEGNHELELDFDFFHFIFEDQIRGEDPNAVVQNDPCGPQVVRDPVVSIVAPLLGNAGATPCPATVGEVLIVNTGFFNSGETKTVGFDISARYSFSWGANLFTFRNETSHVNTYEVQVTDGGPILKGVGFRNDGNPGVATPKWKTNFFLSWAREADSVNITIRHTSQVEDDAFGLRTGNKGLFGQVDGHTEVDVQYQRRLGSEQQYSLTVGAINVFDNAPPKATFTGYLEELHNPFMRQSYFRVGLAL